MKPYASSSEYPERVEIQKVTIDNPNFNKILEAKKRIVKKGVYQPSEAYLAFKKKMSTTIFPKQPCKRLNQQHVDRFFGNLFNVQTY